MQKQSRVFFQISGAGHEALGLGPGPPPPSGLRLVLPVLPGPGARARARRRAQGHPAPGRGIGRGPGQRWPPDAEPLGSGRDQPRHPVEPHRQPVHPGGGLRRGGPVHRAPAGARPARPRRRADLRQPRRGCVQRGRVLGEPQHRLQPAPAGALRRARQRLRHLGAIDRPAARPRRRPRGRLPRPRHPSPRRDRLLRRPARRQGHRRAGPCRYRPRAAALRRRAAVLALGRRHAGQVPLGRRAGRRGPSRPHRDRWSVRSSSGA